jgi:phosphoglycolate phosphatase
MPGEMKQVAGGPPRLVVLDLDGTLVDSLGDIAASANQSLVEAFGEGARQPDEVVRGFVGSGARRLIERCVQAAGQSPENTGRLLERFFLIYSSRLTQTTRPYPGIEESLDELAETARLAVLTNKPGVLTRRILHHLGLGNRFIAVVGGDDGPSMKPDPSGLLELAAEAGADPRDMAMVGDSAIDILTARHAGTRAVGVLWGYDRAGVLREKPDVLVETPAGLRSKVLFDPVRPTPAFRIEPDSSPPNPRPAPRSARR